MSTDQEYDQAINAHKEFMFVEHGDGTFMVLNRKTRKRHFFKSQNRSTALREAWDVIQKNPSGG